VSDDRFGDLGPGDEPDRRSAAERFEERDRTHPEPDAKRPEVPRPSSRYAWVVGVAFLIVIIVAGISSIPNKGASLFGPKPHTLLPRFSAPLASSGLEGDANVCQHAPCQKNAGAEPACAAQSASVLNSCKLAERPVVITFAFDRGADCFPQVDRVQRALPRLRGVSVATVYFSRNPWKAIRRNVASRRWTMPVGVDHDGAVTNLYSVGGCPTTVFANRGGRVRTTRLGPLTEDQVVAEARRLR
jgi:peroxiredoxin